MKVFVGCNQVVISGLARACELLRGLTSRCEEIISLVDVFQRWFRVEALVSAV